MGRRPKTEDTKKLARTVYATNPEWSKIQAKADEVGKEASPYVIEKALK